MSTSEEIAQHVISFRQWISERFTSEDIASGNVDDTGYPHWDLIKKTFKRVFKEENLNDMSPQDLDNLVYLIARQWDRGGILNWFDKGDRRISFIGMNGFHLFALSEAGLRTPERDARYQFAASLYKLGPDKRVISLLLQYLKDEDSYTRTMALRSLSRINYEGIVEKIKYLWDAGDEWNQMMCISIAKDHDETLFKELLEKGMSSKKELLEDFIKRNEYGT